MPAPDVMERVLFTEKDIKERCQQLADQISKDYANSEPVLVCTLKGGFMFFSDLVKKINCDFSIEYIKASSYIGAQTSGNVTLQNFVNFEVKNKDILIIEDIVDTGLTCEKLISYFNEKGAKSVEICTMLDKKERRLVHIEPKYVGFAIPNYFVIGYGLDYNEKYRNIPAVGIMNMKYVEK